MIIPTGCSHARERSVRMSTLSSDFEQALRRLKPHKHRRQLKRRQQSQLPFLAASSQAPPSFLYDTTVYVDVLQGRFPERREAMLRATGAWHSTVAQSELAAGCALLDPAHKGTREAIKRVIEVIERMPS